MFAVLHPRQVSELLKARGDLRGAASLRGNGGGGAGEESE